MKKREYTLDIFKLFNDLDDPKKVDVYSSLSESEKKGFSPLIIMRWMTGTSDPRQIVLMNTLVNPFVFSLAKHPQLLGRLIESASSKIQRRYYYLKVDGKKGDKELIRLFSEYFDISPREARMIDPIPPLEELLEMTQELGWEKAETDKLKKEITK